MEREYLATEVISGLICPDCGAIVSLTYLHDEWHNRIDKMARTAERVDDAAACHMPTGMPSWSSFGSS